MMFRFVFLMTALFVLVGCSSSGPALPAIVPTKGKVYLANGEPLRGGRLIFSTKDANRGGIEPFADIDKDGTFTVTTYQLNDGCVPGKYVVSVNPYTFKSGTAVKVPNHQQIPARYLKEETSDWLVEIKSEDTVLTLKCKDR